MFMEDCDSYKLRDGTEGAGGFESIESESDSGVGKLTLHDLQSYDEMPLSAFLSVSTRTHFINDGDRFNGGNPGKKASFMP